jgi:hypothetical protein
MTPGILVLVLLSDLPASRIHHDEVVTLFPALVTRAAAGDGWDCAVQGWIYEPANTHDLARWIRFFGEDEALERKGYDADLIAGRLSYFLADNESRKRIRVRVGEVERTLPPSGEDGLFRDIFPLTAAQVEALGRDPAPRIRVVLPERDRRVFAAPVVVVPPEGVSVVCDIDDTVRISHVGDHGALAKALLREFRAVPGAAEVLSEWQRVHGASFHYVSASPWQLYVPLTEFFEREGLPTGAFHLKCFRWKETRVGDLFEAQNRHKLEILAPLLEALPRRRFVLLGDASEQDPEIYAELAQRYPAQVQRILIRDPDGRARQRCEALFEELPAGVGRTFAEFPEIRAALP